MDKGLLLIFALTFVIHLIGTLAYSVRIAGTRTRRIAISLSLFNILVLVSRTSNSFAAPLLAKRVEQNIAHGFFEGAASDFRWLLLSATLASILGGVCIPAVQRLLVRSVESFARHGSVIPVFLRSFTTTEVIHLRESVQ